MTHETEGQQAAVRIGGRRSVVTGALVGLALQLLGVYVREDGIFAIVGIFLFLAGIVIRKRLSGGLPPPPPPSDSDASWRYKREVKERTDYARIDFATWGGTMVIVEVVIILLFSLLGIQVPVAQGVP